MTINVRYLDVSDAIKSGKQPVLHVNRPFVNRTGLPAPFSRSQPGRTGTFWVPNRRILDPADQGWACTKQGDIVIVPLFAYQTSSPSSSKLVAAGMTLGIAAIDGFRRIHGAIPIESHLFVSDRCYLDEARNRYDFYFGLTLRIA
jgi:hypothetical protein